MNIMEPSRDPIAERRKPPNLMGSSESRHTGFEKEFRTRHTYTLFNDLYLWWYFGKVKGWQVINISLKKVMVFLIKVIS